MPRLRVGTIGRDAPRPARPRGAQDQPQERATRAAERGRADAPAARAVWDAFAAGIDPRRLVFLDETSGATAMTRLYGRGPTSERVRYAVPHGHRKTTPFVAASRLDGLFAPLVVDGPLNGELSAAHARQRLAPQPRPGDILVMDDLQAHKVAAAVAAVRAADAAVVHPPPYRPDFDPIEQVFSKVKNESQRRGLRTVVALEAAFGEPLDWITPAGTRHYFQNSGYRGHSPG